ncbi:MAG: low affinity iron permease family protein [Gaiellaceae bacterium]
MQPRLGLIRRIALRTPEIVGAPSTFLVALVLSIGWLIGGTLSGWSSGWLLWPSAIASVVTFLIVFSLQYSQNRDTRAIQLKLDEIVRATEHARTELVKLERLPDAELAKIEQEIVELRERESR